MINYQQLIEAMRTLPALRDWADLLPGQTEQAMSPARWGDLSQWQKVLDALPPLQPSTLNLHDAVQIGAADDCSAAQREQLRQVLMGLHPWRKGPYDLFDLHIDTEWRSDWKWQRLLPSIQALQDRLVLDVGCGNGYHCWRMLGAGARRVIGIDPSVRFVFQFYALKHYVQNYHNHRHYGQLSQAHIPVDILPLGIEALPAGLAAFDTVFSMGVLYHRRSPMDHLRELRGLLRPGGELVLETLVLNNNSNSNSNDGGSGQVLVPEGRYGKMPNVWFIPTADTLLAWLRKCGFRNEACVDIAPTTTDEQRSTAWMTFESLADFLDPENPQLTVEGHPAPVRAIFTATAPS